jgi:glycosyltransferase involved in cell wall biosynthesis
MTVTNKNILYIGPYRQNDSWGESCRSYIRAISSNKNFKLKIHPIYYTNNIIDIDDSYKALESNNFDSYDYVVQQCLPGDFFYDGRYSKNIAITLIETSDWTSCKDSVYNLNSMDEIWIQSDFEKQNLLKSGVSKTIKSVGYPVDVELINSTTNRLQMPKVLQNLFKFYFIGDYSNRQNLHDLIIAFNLAFRYSDDVSLVLKINNDNMDPQSSRQKIEDDILNIKKSMGLERRFKKEFIITEKLDNKQIIQLHNSCDCLVSPSYSETFSKNIMEALALGKTPIVNKNSIAANFVNENNGYLFKSYKTPIILPEKPLSKDYDFYNANQYWFKADIYDLKDKLLLAYKEHQDKTILQTKVVNGQSKIETFESVGANL